MEEIKTMSFTVKMHYRSGHVDLYQRDELIDAIAAGEKMMECFNKPISPAFEADCEPTHFTVVSSLPVYDSREGGGVCVAHESHHMEYSKNSDPDYSFWFCSKCKSATKYSLDLECRGR